MRRRTERWPRWRPGALVAALLAWVLSADAMGQGPLRIDGSVERIDLQPYVDLYEDTARRLSAQEALGLDAFAPNLGRLASLGFSDSALWIRFALQAAPGGPRRVLASIGYPPLDEVSLTLVLPDGRIEHSEAGDTHPFSERSLRYAQPTFAVPLSEDGPTLVLLRIATQGSLQFPLTLWDEGAFGEHYNARQFYYGIYYGVYVILATLAVTIFVFSRDRVFLLYALYLACYALLQFCLNGFFPQYLWPQGGEIVNRLPPLLGSTTMVLLILFTIRFLGIWHRSAPLRWLFASVLTLVVAGIPLSLLGPIRLANTAVTISGVLLLPIILTITLLALRRGVQAARYFAVAWGLFLLGVFITSLTLAGVLPAAFHTTYAMQIGSGLEVWMLALALLDRVRLLREEKDDAVTNANRYLTQLNERLEGLVGERTRELERRNRQLRRLADRDSLTGLLNHRAANRRLAAMLAESARRGEPVAALMLDIDHFKQINDRFGHQTGDRVLEAVAKVLQASTGAEDICGRYGGEEFLLATRIGRRSDAESLAERLRRQIHGVLVPSCEQCAPTASLGVAIAHPGAGVSADDLIGLADAALYRAKAEGRDRVVFAEDSGRPGAVVVLRS